MNKLCGTFLLVSPGLTWALVELPFCLWGCFYTSFLLLLHSSILPPKKKLLQIETNHLILCCPSQLFVSVLPYMCSWGKKNYQKNKKDNKSKGKQSVLFSKYRCSGLLFLLLILHTSRSCDTGLQVKNGSFLKGSLGPCKSRRQEAVRVCDNHVEWTMLQIGTTTRMPSLTGRPYRNWPQMQTHAMRSTTKQNS